MSDKSSIIPVVQAGSSVLPDEPDPASPEVGKWYWVRDKEKADGEDDARWFGCATSVGSNYVEMTAVGKYAGSTRVHLDDFWDLCEWEPDPDAYIGFQVESRRDEVNLLMGKVRDITSRLALSSGPALSSGEEVRALAVRTADRPVDEYKDSLVRAKEQELPELFKQIEEASADMASWMKAKLIPMKAHVKQIKPVMEAIQDRIFNVELYAGLVEQVVQVRKGEPATMSSKVHLLQRMHYMDEECLANYDVGGMEFKDLEAFDRWMAKRSSFERLLPFDRCIIAMRVRRDDKERDWGGSLEALLEMSELMKLDKATFLYIRNGDQLFRLSTGIEFEERLFPDLSEDQLSGKLYYHTGRVGDEYNKWIITENEWLGKKDEYLEAEKELEGLSERDRFFKDRRDHFDNHERYEPFDQSSVHYDDVLRHIQGERAKHNRLVLVLQGLLDRSPVLHPHPPWSLWDPDSFKAALELVHDDSRALVPGDVPDFEAYRTELNRSIRPGSITVGQEEAWERVEAEKENVKHRNASRWHDYTRYRPPGNPGPGKLAYVQSVQPKVGKCTYAWNRESTRYGVDDEYRCTFAVDTKMVLNVSAYKPGDFRRFFADPRTRKDYLRWAPLLLEAEEFHAGNREVTKPPAPPPKKGPSREGRLRHRMRKRRNYLIGKAVRLTRDVTMKGGQVYKEGTLWRVLHGSGTRFDVEGIRPDGTPEKKGRWIRELDEYYFREAPDVPALEVKDEQE